MDQSIGIKRPRESSDGDADKLLVTAAEDGSVSGVLELLEKGANIDARSSNGWNSLHWACERHSLEVAKVLIAYGADLNAKSNLFGDTALHKASLKGHVDVAKLLLKNGANINIINKNGETPFHQACEKKNLGVIKLLMENGTNVNAKTNSGLTPLLISCACDVDIVRWEALLKEYDENDDLATLLLDIDEDENAYDEFEHYLTTSPMVGSVDERVLRKFGFITKRRLAQIKIYLKKIELLVENGADVNAKSNDGETPFLKACENRMYTVAKLLMENGADVNAKNKNGETPLYLACENYKIPVNCRLDFVKFLIENGADVNAKSNDGETALHGTCRRGYLEVAQLLLSRGANVNEESNRGFTPLHAACEENRLHVVWFLLRHYPWLVAFQSKSDDTNSVQ